MEYTGLNMHEALELPCDMFMLCKKNQEIYMLMQTEEGREYLEECRIANQSEPDWEGVHRIMGKLRG